LQGVSFDTLYKSVVEDKAVEPVKEVTPQFDFFNSVMPQIITDVKRLRTAIVKEDLNTIKHVTESLQETLLMIGDATKQ
jgi:hypothetical protein